MNIIIQISQPLKKFVLKLKMYINQPALKGNHRKGQTMSKAINQYQFSTPSDQKVKNIKKEYSKNSRNKINSKSNSKNRIDPANIIDSVEATPVQNAGKGVNKKYRDQIQFENNLIDDLGQLIKKWENNLASVKKQIKKFDNVPENQTEIKAFEHCISLLDAQFDQAQAIHESARGLIDKKILQVEELKLRLMHDVNKAKQQCNKIAQQNQKIADIQRQREKKKAQKKLMQSKVQQQKSKIQRIKNSLAQNKKKSYQQKNQFIQLQTEQFRLQSQIRSLDEEEQKIEEEILRAKKYQELLKIKQKIIASHQKIQEEARPHLERKIDKMARLRSQTNNIDQVLEVCLQKIQDQNIVIEALKEKSYHEETYHNTNNSDQPSLYEMYLKKYNNIYFGDQSGKSQWNDYNTYLKHLLNRNRDNHERLYTEMPSIGHKKYSMNDIDRKKARLYTQGSLSGNQVLDLRPNMKRPGMRITQDKFGNNSTKISNNPEKYRSQRVPKKQTQGTKLPRLVKLEGKEAEQKNIKDNVKKGIIKNTNKEQDFSLQSVKSNDSRLSGQIIEVQFHKR